MTRRVDLLVAGGGPAGLVTALHAARAGLDVEVWEPRPGAVDKACGEGLMPGALADLLELGVDPPGHAFHGIRYVAGERRADAAFRAGAGRGIRRTTLHGALIAAVTAAGARVEQRAVGDLRQDDEAVVVDGVRARHLVAADGLHSPVRRGLGLDPAPARHRRYGVRRHFRTAPWSPFVEVHWAPDVEAYVTPVADDLVGVAVLASSRGTFPDRLAALPGLEALLDGAEPASAVRGAGPLRQRVRRRVAGRVLLVGDAAGYVDALTGEGLALAFAQAGAAVRAITDGAPQRYDREWARLTRRYRWLTGALLLGTRPRPARRALVPAARMLPPLFDGAVNGLARPVGA
ncbi:NAD(P)/FAD-dependent oxidoreductase [Actinomycetospora straminea]|uniref:NAD(P)/FAD-dependent oxidoreductase n=1 Tax=Actinomycetospora straminea TaxID=663607 RepID=A0ABP9F515_9PSEU|nr:NAD(P)/FAD-dependent oxidoreductase [Actinomycetospora straminea]MDD7936193.1 NAD(P)/FAD-dependent oxidoreductase [Actinomycetospora straminea]